MPIQLKHYEFTPILAGIGTLPQGPGVFALTVQPMARNDPTIRVPHAWSTSNVRESADAYIRAGELNRAVKQHGQGARVCPAFKSTANLHDANMVAADLGFPGDAIREAKVLAESLLERQWTAERRRVEREQRLLNMEIRVEIAELIHQLRQRGA